MNLCAKSVQFTFWEGLKKTTKAFKNVLYSQTLYLLVFLTFMDMGLTVSYTQWVLCRYWWVIV